MKPATKTMPQSKKLTREQALKVAEVLATTVFVVAVSDGTEEWVDSIYEETARARAQSWAQFMRELRPQMRVRLVAVHGRRAIELARLSDLIDFYSEDEADREQRSAIIAQRDRVFAGGPFKADT